MTGNRGWIYDTLQNFVTGLGMMGGKDQRYNTQYVLNLLNRQDLENLYRSDWMARKIVDAPAEDMTRQWRHWQASADQIETLEGVEKAHNLQEKVKNWIIRARLYGGAALVLGVDDGNQPDEPVDLDSVKKDSLKFVVVLNRYELNAGPRIYNVDSPWYTRPAYYTVATPMFGFSMESGITQPVIPGESPRQSVPGAIRNALSNVIPFRRALSRAEQTIPMSAIVQIHPSRVIELAGNALPDWRLAPMGGGWGDSVLQTVDDTLRSVGLVFGGVAAMINDAKMDVVKIPDMTLNMSNEGYKEQLMNRFALANQSKSIISALLLDKEEEWQRINTNFGGLPMVIHEYITLVSGAAGIPVTRLFGQAQGRGLSGGSTGGAGDSDLRNYYDDCAAKQKTTISPTMSNLDQIVLRSALGEFDPNVYYDWTPLYETSAEDKAKIAYQKAQTTQIYVNSNIINEDALRAGIINQLNEDGVYPGLDDAIEEFGDEPEQPEDTGGYVPGQGPEPGTEPPLTPEQQAGATGDAAPPRRSRKKKAG